MFTLPSYRDRLQQCVAASGVGRDSSAGIVTHYRMDGPGIESWWGGGEISCTLLVLGPTQPPAQWLPGLSQG
jgi:hypothetical protein